MSPFKKPQAETSGAVGVIAVAATYIYFLLFAQFGFLHLLEQRLSTAAWRPTMAAMGLAGLATSLGVAVLYRRLNAERWIRLGFIACGASAAITLVCYQTWAFIAVAAAIGASTAC